MINVLSSLNLTTKNLWVFVNGFSLLTILLQTTTAFYAGGLHLAINMVAFLLFRL